jgi:hypothetical protein
VTALDFPVLPVPGTSPTFAVRVFAAIDFGGDCWEWTRATNKGYGVIGRGARGTGLEQAHRAVWQLLVGQIADGLQLDHLCRNHACCNPDHLEPVTAEVNKARGFSPAVLHSRRDTCEYGHPKDGRLGRFRGKARHRYCKTCARQNSGARYVPKGPKTACKNGHEYTPETTYTDPKYGKRTCRICKITRQREARAAARQETQELAA